MSSTQYQQLQDIIICKNCGKTFEGNYCSHCGQKANIPRLDLKHVLHNFFHAITHMDTGYLYTIRELTLRPGTTIREYLSGKRVKHRDPLLMLLIIGGLCSVLYNHFHLKTVSSIDISSFEGDMPLLTMKYFAITFTGYALVFSLCDYLIFRYKRYNFFELFVMNIFGCIEILMMMIVVVPLWLLFSATGLENYLRIFMSILVLGYLFLVRWQFFEATGHNGTRIRIYGEMFVFILIFILTGWKTYRNLL